MSILACPLLFAFLGDRFFWFAAIDSLRVRLVAMGVATALAAVALLRIRFSRGALLGVEMARAHRVGQRPRDQLDSPPMERTGDNAILNDEPVVRRPLIGLTLCVAGVWRLGRRNGGQS